MRKHNLRSPMQDTVLLSGWLFADLLLGLMVIFLAASALGIKPLPIPTPTPHPAVKPTPTPTPTQAVATPLPRLELTKHRITLTIDTNSLLNNSAATIANLKQQMRGQSMLKGRSAGLVIVYGGAPDVTQVPTAQSIASKVMDVLKSLGNEGFVFGRASYYDPLYILYGDANTVVIDIYLFA